MHHGDLNFEKEEKCDKKTWILRWPLHSHEGLWPGGPHPRPPLPVPTVCEPRRTPRDVWAQATRCLMAGVLPSMTPRCNYAGTWPSSFSPNYLYVRHGPNWGRKGVGKKEILISWNLFFVVKWLKGKWGGWVANCPVLRACCVPGATLGAL